MAYSTSNPPQCVNTGLFNGLGKTWVYRSTDAASAVRVAGYFTDGYDRGMRAGDVIYVTDTDASPLAIQIHIVNAASAAGGVDLSDGVAITATDTD